MLTVCDLSELWPILNNRTDLHNLPYMRYFRHHMAKATENDTDLLTEVQSFWTEPASHISLSSENEISCIAEGVLSWLKVCSNFLLLYLPIQSKSQ